MKNKFKKAYIDVAHRFSQLSSAVRLKVGAIVVKDDRIISIGYNGMPTGWDNNCEDKLWMPADAGGWLDPEEVEKEWPYIATSDTDGSYTGRYKLVTKPEVLHAESNALAKLARSGESGLGADLFVTHSPCLDCAKMIYQTGIKHVFYSKDYRDDSGIKFLRASGIVVEKVDID